MSIKFSSYVNSDPYQAGYFRIGFVTLQIPPESIVSSRVSNNEKIPTLRGLSEMFKKTGQSRWDTTIKWTVLKGEGDPSTMPEVYKQWEDLTDIVAIFKAAPFVEVESPHLRQLLITKDISMSTRRIGMALRQLRIDTHPDITDALNVTLTMSLFNYMPYTIDFSYRGLGGDAYQSDVFRTYIKTWKETNMVSRARYRGDWSAPDWKMAQTPGVMKLKWRQYLALIDGQKPNLSGAVLPSGGYQMSGPGAMSKGGGIENKGAYDSIIVREAQAAGIDPALVKAYMEQESNFNPTACNPNTAAVKASEVRDQIQRGSDGGTAFLTAKNLRPDFGLMQLNWWTAHGRTDKSGKFRPGLDQNVRPVDLMDPTINIRLGCKYIKQLIASGMSDTQLYAYNTGSPKSFITPEVAKAKGWTPSADYQASVSSKRGKWSKTPPTPGGGVPPPAATPPPAKPAEAKPTVDPKVTPGAGDANASLRAYTDDPKVDAKFKEVIKGMIDLGWKLDHRTDGVGFFYRENELKMVPLDNVSNEEQVTQGLYPVALSVLLVNNLAQIPLAAYQYPTYQHVGPCSSLISMSFTSQGDRENETSEPWHAGLIDMATMAHALEDQYIKLRTSFRRVSSIHRMQAVFVENQVLNMLGIHGMMLDQLTTSTMDDAADLVSVQLTASQYENVFEDIGSYKTNGIPETYRATLRDIVLKGNDLDGLPDDQKAVMHEVMRFRKAMDGADEKYLSEWIMKACKVADTPMFTYMAGATEFIVDASDRAAIGDYIQKLTNKLPGLAQRAPTLAGTRGFSIVDFLAVKEGIAANYNGGSEVTRAEDENIVSAISDNLNKLGTRNALVKDAYVRLFPYISATDGAMRAEMNMLMNSPKFNDRIKNAVPPAQKQRNDHGAYHDMGLNKLQIEGEDFNPGMYFTNHNDDYRKKAKEKLAVVLGEVDANNKQVNKVTGEASQPTISVTSGIPNDPDSIMRMTNIPGYDMAEAFPTFKLFFMEEDNLGVFQSFDNFYSYAAVSDIEIIRPKDKAATAIIQISNLSHLLNHKLFDDTMAGARELEMVPYGTLSPVGDLDPATGVPDVVASPGGINPISKGGKTVGGEPYMNMGYDHREGYPKDLKRRRIPLKYFPLQTGTKIQIRAGYRNDPEALTPVFCGTVTEIQGDDLMTVTCQSFLLELQTLSLGDLKQGDEKAEGPDTNRWFKLGSLTLSGKSPAYGGITIFGEGGDVGSILEHMLKSSNARHFGHWQVNVIPNALLKGFTWTSMAAPVVGVFSDKMGALMQSNYDRCGENIMVNQIVNYTGEKTSGSRRDYFDQGNSAIRPFSYYVDAKTSFTLWELMQDVSRRYPEYLLLEKWYGFPYGCDATLVFGHPFDHYYSRPTLIGENERLRAIDSDGRLYKEWWESVGNNQLQEALKAVSDRNILTGYSGKDDAAKGPAQLDAFLKNVLQSQMDLFGIVLPMDWANNILGSLTWLNNKLAPARMSELKQTMRELDAVRKSYESFVLLHDPKATDRLKPIRKYHFIDDATIIHNGMILNEKINNVVRIGDGESNGVVYPISANANIPTQHCRVLDVTELINDPKRNVINPTTGFVPNGWETPKYGLVMAYAQSFLREEVGKMYRGEIVLRGVPEIEPCDILLMMDPSTSIVGCVEVDQVIHSFNPQNGFITIVKPRAMVVVNEAASSNFVCKLFQVMSTTLPLVRRVSDMTGAALGINGTELGVPAAGIGGTVKWLVKRYAPVAAENTIAAVEGLVGAEGELMAAAGVADGAAASGLGAAAAVGIFANPVVLPITILCVIGLAVGVLWFVNKNSGLNPLMVIPVTRFARPWVGGLQGFEVTDLVGLANNNAKQFMADEIYPTIELWKYYNEIGKDYMDIPTAAGIAAGEPKPTPVP